MELHETPSSTSSSSSPSDLSLSDFVTFHMAQGSHFHVVRVRDEVNEVAEHSLLEVAKFELNHLCPTPFERDQALDTRHRHLYHVLPPLKGEYQNIGYTKFVIDGPHREIGVEVFAPTRASSGHPLHMQLLPGEFWAATLSTDQIQALQTHSLDSLQRIGKFPLLIFSHGWDIDPMTYRPLLEELASHGYEVWNLNHPSSSGHHPLSDTHAVLGDRDEAGCEDSTRITSELNRVALIQADNIQFIVEHVRRDRGRREAIVLAGHSLGGAASIIAARRDPEISACINLDGKLFGDKTVDKTAPLSTPLLQIFCDHPPTPEGEQVQKDYRELQDHSENVQMMPIAGTEHMDFTVYPLLRWLLGGNVGGAFKAHKAASRAMVQFMNDWCRFQTHNQ